MTFRSNHHTSLAVTVLLACGTAGPSSASAQNSVSVPVVDTAPLSLRDVVTLTLAHSASIERARLTILSQEGALLQVNAQFDPVLRASVNRMQTRTPLFATGSDPTSIVNASLGYELGVDWTLPVGLAIAPAVSFSRADIAPGVGEVRNIGTAGLSLVLPLLRGRGGGDARAAQRATSIALEASRADAEYAQRGSIRAAMVAYWQYVAARAGLQVLRGAEARAITLVQQTRALIAADERPAVDSLTVLANVAAKSGARLNGQNTVTTALFELAAATGLPSERIAVLDRPTGQFPAIPDDDVLATWPPEDVWVTYALARRQDLTSAQQQSAGARELVRGAANAARSRLNLRGGLAYTGIGLGDHASQLLTPFNSRRSGAHLEIALEFDNPLVHSVAVGELQRRVADERQATLAADELARTVALAVRSSAQTLHRHIEESRLAFRALGLYAAAVEGERQKYQLGTATLFDVIFAVDNLTAAELGWISAQQRYANAVTDLLYQAGVPLGTSGCAAQLPAPVVLPDAICPF